MKGRHHYITHKRGLSVVTSAGKVWRCRSTCKDALQHDYHKVHSLDDVLQWMRLDVGRSATVVTREEALGHISTLSDYDQNFLVHSPPERALAHLEEGW